MAKGYIVANIRVRDNGSLEKFIEMVKPIFKEYDAKVLVRTPNAEVREGKKTGIVVVLEFKSMDQARQVSDTDLFLAEGV